MFKFASAILVATVQSETIFVVEMIRHGARSAENHFERTNGQSDFDVFGNVKPGWLTDRGIEESRDIGR
jgi:hypothetical protein